MASIYDVFCPECNLLHLWCKYDEPISNCERCGYEMSEVDENGETRYKAECPAHGAIVTRYSAIKR